MAELQSSAKRGFVVGLLRNTQIEEELKREIASHLVLLEDDFKRQGMSGEEARVAARRA